VLDLNAGEADIAIRYARKPPSVGPCVEFLRDSFYVVASPKLVGQMQKSLSPAGLTQFPLIEIEWPPTDAEAPRWQRWQNLASRSHKSVPDLAGLPSLSFREELHAIEAAIAGQAGLEQCDRSAPLQRARASAALSTRNGPLVQFVGLPAMMDRSGVTPATRPPTPVKSTRWTDR
jgi:DNA-binding transcriptional LysR family regulator